MLAMFLAAAVSSAQPAPIQPSLEICQAALVYIASGAADVGPMELIDRASTKLKFTDSQRSDQEAICVVYFQGVQDALALSQRR